MKFRIGHRGSRGSTAPAGSLARTAAKRTRRGTITAVLFFAAFFVMGGAFFYFAFLRSALNVLAARHWPAVPCTVLRSAVEQHRSDDGYTYSIEIAFQYEYAGRTYTAETYSFAAASTGGRTGKEVVVRNHPPGKQTTCYVNPDDPSQAVIHRGMTRGIWVPGLVSAPFMLVGVGGMVGTLVWRARRRGEADSLVRQAGRQTPSRHAAPDLDKALRDLLPPYEQHEGPVQLEPSTSRWAKIGGLGVFALIWNGLVGFFFVMSINDGNWFVVAFLSIFVLVGFAVILGLIYELLALFNPRLQVTVNQRAIALGEPFDIAWDVVGNTARISRLEITLEGREQARYRRGTNTVTDHSTFARLPLTDTDSSSDMASGVASTTIPSDTMHSLKLNDNEIQWRLVVRGHIRRWPDVTEAFDIVVLPPGVEGLR